MDGRDAVLFYLAEEASLLNGCHPDRSEAEWRDLLPVSGVTVHSPRISDDRWMQDRYHVYILASKSRALYVGVTCDLIVRLRQHCNGTFDGST